MSGIKYIIVGVLSLGFLGLISSIHIELTDTLELVCPAALLLVALVAGAVALKSGVNWYTRYRMEREIHEINLAKARLDLALVAPDTNGLLPVARQWLESGAITHQALMLAAAHIANGRPVANVPHTITYSPHMAYKSDGNAIGQDTQTAPATAAPGDFWSLYSAGALPNNGFLMGYSLEDGRPVTADWRQLYSALIGGQSGSGKSTLIRNILAQSALQGGRFVVLDKHYGAGEESLGASLAPLRPMMLCDVASDEKQMVDALHFVADIGRRRLTGQDSDKTPLILVVDETTALLQRSNVASELTNVLGTISQETRKVGVYALCIGQNFNGEIMDTTVRNSFVSMIATRSRRDVARTQSGNNEFAKLAETLTTGQAVWMDPSGVVTKISVPNTTQAHIGMVAAQLGTKNGQNGAPAKVLPTPGSTTSKPLPDPANDDDLEGLWKANGSAMEAALPTDATANRVLSLFRNGATMHEIVQEVYGVNGGRKYQEARAEVESVIRDQLR